MSLPPKDLARQTSRGFMWVTGLTMTGKVVGMVCQVGLAALLSRDAYGLVSMAGFIQMLGYLLADPGIQIMLIQRGKRFARWSPPAFWLGMSGSICASILMVATAPLVGWFYGEPRVVGLIYVLAMAPPLSALSIPARALIRHQLRFKLLAVINFIQATSQLLMTLLLAWLGFGAYSFVIPVPISFALVALLTWIYAHPPIRWRFSFRQWRYMLTDVRNLLLTQALAIFTSQGDYVILGHFHGSDVAGIYFFAFGLSSQTFYLLSSNALNVLMPSLSRLSFDPQRQCRAYIRSARMLSAVMVPTCLLQAALSDAGIHLLFQPRWYPAIPVLQLLSLGWVSVSISVSSAGLIQAQGRYGTLLIRNAFNAIGFLIAITIGAKLGEATSVSAAYAIYSGGIAAPACIFVAIYYGGGRLMDLWRIFMEPLLVAAVSILPFMVLAYYTPHFRGYDLYAFTLIISGTIMLYPRLLKRLLPEVWQELVSNLPGGLSKILLKLSGGKPATLAIG